MNIYYSSNRNNIDDTNKLFYKVVILPNFTKFTLYIDLIHDIIPVHSGLCEPSGRHRELWLHSAGTGRSTPGHSWGHTWRLCHFHGHCGLCDAVQAQALGFMVLSARGGRAHSQNCFSQNCFPHTASVRTN